MSEKTIVIPRAIENKAASLYEQATIVKLKHLKEWKNESPIIKNQWRLKAFVQAFEKYNKHK